MVSKRPPRMGIVRLSTLGIVEEFLKDLLEGEYL